mgnify:FL=1
MVIHTDLHIIIGVVDAKIKCNEYNILKVSNDKDNERMLLLFIIWFGYHGFHFHQI